MVDSDTCEQWFSMRILISIVVKFLPNADFLCWQIAVCVMPGFHHYVVVSPFRCAFLTFRCTVAVLLFEATVAVAGENGNAGNVFPYT